MTSMLNALSSIQHMRDKPHSSITDWIELLSSQKYLEDDYEGIPELVDSINLQAAGPTEAARAIRKKLKYGDVHRQLRALTILKALVENCGTKFQTTFSTDPLTGRIKAMASDPLTDEQVKKKLMSVLGSWHRQFKDDPRMHLIADLYIQCGGNLKRPAKAVPSPATQSRFEEQQRRAEEEARQRAERKERERREREDAKAKAKADKEKARKAKAAPVVDKTKTKRKPFNFEQEKPAVLSSISSASQASNNLINALKLVNREQESIESNARVQECLEAAKVARKPIVRYIQLVENEEFIGTLIDSNERVIAALQLYDQMLKRADQDSEDDLPSQLDSMTITPGPEPELEKLQERQRAQILRAARERKANAESGPFGSSPPPSAVHPDLQDLSFGDLGQSGSALPPPIRPNEPVSEYEHGSLSDYSDYDSSDEGTRSPAHGAGPSSYPGGNRGYDKVVAPDAEGKHALLDFDDDPFADPTDVGTPGIVQRQPFVF